MKAKYLAVIVAIIVAVAFIWGPISGVQNGVNQTTGAQVGTTRADGTAAPSPNSPAAIAADKDPVPMSYDTLYRDLSTSPATVTKLLFVKDEAGNVQYVNATYKDGRNVRVEIPGQAGAAQLLDAATKGNVPNDTKKSFS